MIRNKNRKTKLVSKTIVCKTTIQKARGLMFSNKIEDTGMLFIFDSEQKVSLHMFFVFFCIDIVWLDKNFSIIDVKKNAVPFEPLIKSDKPAKYVLELPAGTVEKSKTRLGDKLEITEKESSLINA